MCGFDDILMNIFNDISPELVIDLRISSLFSHFSPLSIISDEPFPVQIKDEPQTVPSSPPMSPIDMESQEKIKLERKRQRNRVAASKCRKRKLERISKLEDKVKGLKGENAELASIVKALKEHVCQLKQQLIDHINSGCDIPVLNVAIFKGNNNSDIKQ